MGKYFPFFVTSNEVRCSEAMARQYHLYRLFRFTQRPRLYVLHGALSDLCRLGAGGIPGDGEGQGGRTSA